MNPQELGRWGEALARDFLQEKGYRILEAPYRSPLGELDLIAEKGGCLVFVEVKTRTSGDFAPAELAVNAHKQKNMIQSALFYLKTRRSEDRPARFDVVAIEAGVPRLIENAFEART